MSNNLFRYAQIGNIEKIKSLLEQGADINLQDDDNWTALHYAVDDSQSECLTFLIEQGISLEAKDKEGKTAIYHAAENGEAKCLNILIKHGANIHTTDNHDWTALHAAATNGFVEKWRRLYCERQRRIHGIRFSA